MQLNQAGGLFLKVSVSKHCFGTSRSREDMGKSRSGLGLEIRSLSLGPQGLVYIPELNQLMLFDLNLRL